MEGRQTRQRLVGLIGILSLAALGTLWWRLQQNERAFRSQRQASATRRVPIRANIPVKMTPQPRKRRSAKDWLRHLRQKIRRDPCSIERSNQMLRGLGQATSSEALSRLEKHARQCRERLRPIVLQELARLQHKHGRWDGLLRSSNQLLDLQPKGHLGYFYRGIYYHHKKQSGLAVSDMWKALEIQPTLPNIPFVLAKLETNRNNYCQAAKALATGLRHQEERLRQKGRWLRWFRTWKALSKQGKCAPSPRRTRPQRITRQQAPVGSAPRPHPAQHNQIRVPIVKSGPMLFVRMQIGRIQKVYFLLDTGASRTVINFGLAYSLWVMPYTQTTVVPARTFFSQPQHTHATGGMRDNHGQIKTIFHQYVNKMPVKGWQKVTVASSKSYAWPLVNLPQVAVDMGGGRRLKIRPLDAVVSLHGYNIGRGVYGLLGQDFLQQFRAYQIDHSSRQLILTTH